MKAASPEKQRAPLTQEAQMLKDVGCVEALNLDGGGSCLLINGKQTITPSGQRRTKTLPAVFIFYQERFLGLDLIKFDCFDRKS